MEANIYQHQYHPLCIEFFTFSSHKNTKDAVNPGMVHLVLLQVVVGGCNPLCTREYAWSAESAAMVVTALPVLGGKVANKFDDHQFHRVWFTNCLSA